MHFRERSEEDDDVQNHVQYRAFLYYPGDFLFRADFSFRADFLFRATRYPPEVRKEAQHYLANLGRGEKQSNPLSRGKKKKDIRI
jgi:hypothetical protein